MTRLPTLTSLIEIVQSDASSDSPLDQLAQAARSVQAIEEVADNLLGHFVEHCRKDGCSWSEISSVLGVSKQAAHKRFADVMPTVERFTERARGVLNDAVVQARSLGHSFVGTEDLLLALFEPAEALAAQVLREAGFSRDAVIAKLRSEHSSDNLHPQASSTSDQIGYSARARNAIRNSVMEALKLGHNDVGTEHLLLGLFDDPEAVGAKVLSSLGASYENTKERVTEKITTIIESRKQSS